MNNTSTRLYNVLMGNTNNTNSMPNAIGRTAGLRSTGSGDNFFVKRAKSIGNSFGTTGAAVASTFKDASENTATESLLKDTKTRMNDIAKKYGYNTWSDWQDAFEAAKNSGDTAKVAEMNKQLKEFQAQASANSAAANKKAAEYKDYTDNNYISQKINQDRGKFAGSAINTLSTGLDLTGLTANPLANAVQGGVEGLADELEQNGLKDFSAERAGQNAAIGATTGLVTGALNKGISSALAKRGGNLFKGNNALTRGINNLGSKTAIGRIGSTIATGAGRGAISGAVGGATGAGLSAAMNNGDIVGSALEGAKQGLQQGAITGGVMAGTNLALSKTPGVGKFYNDLQSAKTRWDQSGSNFDERLTNTLTSGDSAVGDWLMNKRQSNILGAAGSLGNRVQDVSGTNSEALNQFLKVRDEYQQENVPLSSPRGQYLNELYTGALDDLKSGAYSDNDLLSMLRSTDNVEAQSLISRALRERSAVTDTPTTTNKYIGVDTLGNKTEYTPTQLAKLINEYDNYKQPTTLSGNSFDEVSEVVGPAGSELMNIYKTMNGGMPVDPYSKESWGEFENWVNAQRTSTPTTAKGWAKKAGQRIVEDINNSNLGNRVKDVSGTNSVDGEITEDITKRVLSTIAEIDPNATMEDAYAAGWDLLDRSDNLAELRQNMVKEWGAWMSPEDVDNVLGTAPTTAKGWAKKAGQRIIEDVNNSNLGNRVKDVSSDMPEDIRNMQIRDYNTNADGENNLTYQEALNRGLDQGLSGPELGDTLAPYSNLPTKVTGEELYELVQNDPQLRMATSYVANQIADDGGTPSYFNVANRYWDEVRAQYAQAQNYNGPGDYFDGVETNEMAAPSGTASARTSVQTAQVDPWDRVAQEAGYNNYNEVVQRYMEANPGAQLNPRGAAGQILTWLDQNPNTPTTASEWAKRAGQRIVEGANKRGVGLGIKNAADETTPTTTAQELTPETEVYRALTKNQDTELVAPQKTSKETRLRYARGKELLAQYGTVDQPMARATKAVQAFQEIADMGFEKPGDVEKIANAVTGSNGAVSALTKSVIESAQPVDTFAGAKSRQTLDQFIDESIEKNYLGGTNAGDSVKRGINAYLRGLPSRADGSIDYKDSAIDTFKAVQGLEASAAELEGRGGSTYHRATSEDLRAAKVIKDVANLFKDRIYDGADVKSALTPEVIQNLKALDAGNTKWAGKVDDFVKNASSVKDLRSFQKPFVDAGRYIDNQYIQAATVGGRMATNATELPDILPTTKAGLIKQAVNTVWNSNPAHRAKANLYGKLADREAAKSAANVDANTIANNAVATDTGAAANSGGSTANLGDKIKTFMTGYDDNPSTRLYNAIGRTEGLTNADQARTAEYLTDATQDVSAESGYIEPLGATTAGNTSVYDSLTGNTNTSGLSASSTPQTGYFQPTGDYWTDILAKAMTSAINANDVTAFASLYEMYQDALSKNSSTGGTNYKDVTSWNSTDRTKLLSAENALDQIDQLENAYNTATNSQGSNVIQGWLRSRAADISGGNLDPSASNYNSLAQSVGMGIVKNLINLGVTEADAQRYLQYLPALTDTKEQAAQKLETLRNIYQSQINNLYSAYGL